MKSTKRVKVEPVEDIWYCPIHLHVLQAPVCGKHQAYHRRKCEKIECEHLDQDLAVEGFEEHMRAKLAAKLGLDYPHK